MRPPPWFVFPSKSVRCSPLRRITGHEQLHPFIHVFPYHTVDVHAGLQQGLDGAVVAVPCSQVKRGVPAAVAGHEVGVGVDQHAHHLHTKGWRSDASFVRPLLLRTCQSSVRWRGAAERPGRTISAQQVSSFPENSCLCAAAKLLPRVGYKRVQRQLPPQGFPFIIMQIGRAKKNELFIYAPTNLDGLTAITHCLSRGILFEHRDELQRVL